MPNHVQNILTVTALNETELNHFLEDIKGDKKVIDFNSITPTPKWVSQEQITKEEIEKRGGEMVHWYKWDIENWGTKWNAYEQSISIDKNTAVIKFQTAWTAPLELIKKLGLIFPNLLFCYQWADEDLGRNCGEIRFKETDVAFEQIYKDRPSYTYETVKALKFACDVWEIDFIDHIKYLVSEEE